MTDEKKDEMTVWETVLAGVILVALFGGLIAFVGWATKPGKPDLTGLEKNGTVTGCTVEWVGTYHIERCKTYDNYTGITR